MSRYPVGSRGFTLIELLVALVIFAILALLSYRTLASVLQTREQLQKETTRWRDVSLFFYRLENDLGSLIDRPSRNHDGLTEAAFLLRTLAPGSNEATFTLTRGGFVDATGVSAAPQRVGYRLNGAKLELLLWNSLDNAPRTAPQIHVALNGVVDARWRVLNASNQWQTTWREQPEPDPKAHAFPLALEISLTLTSGETLTRTFALAHE